MDSLPRQITLLAFIAFATIQVILWVSLYSVRVAMNDEAAHESKRQMDGRLKTLQNQVSLIASDYHNWTDLFLNAQHLDYKKLSSNYGITAQRGDIFQYAELFGGPFLKPLSWQTGKGLLPQKGFISDQTREALRNLVSNLDSTERETLDYFDVRDDRIVMFSSSYLLPEDPELLKNLNPEFQAIAAIGKILTEDKISKINTDFSMSGLKVVDQHPTTDVASLPINGMSGKPIAWLEWYPPTPGTVLFQKMIPIMALASLIFAVLFYWGAWLLRDRTTKLLSKEAISFKQARTDALTEIPNRFSLFERLTEISANGKLNCSLLMMDLDNFKQVNDTVGHIGGDLFLKTLASRLQTISDDKTLVARLGGDEFVVVISSAFHIENIITEKYAALEEIMREQILCCDVLFEVMAAKGGALLNSHEFCEKELMRRADIALYAAKKMGNQNIVVYDELMECEDQEHKLIENQLRLDLVDGEGFSIVYQPIVSLSNKRRIVCFEALARWNCDKLGQVQPDKFIKVAENSGLIVSLGWLLLDKICREIKLFDKCKISINVSPIQLMSANFANLFADRVVKYGVRADQIQIEITEQVVVKDDKKILEELTNFRNHGFTLALDDFGTGYASIGYLTRMPFDVLKIDRSFVGANANNLQAQKMVRSMMGLAHAMDLQIIVEGIETSVQAERFSSLGADFLQGYYFGYPKPPKEINEFDFARVVIPACGN